MAQAILASIEMTATPSLWQFATAAEACLVLGRHADSLVWLARYVGSDADAFEYASTLRQLELIWDRDATSHSHGLLIPSGSTRPIPLLILTGHRCWIFLRRTVWRAATTRTSGRSGRAKCVNQSPA